MTTTTFVILPVGYVTACQGDDIPEKFEILRCNLSENEDPQLKALEISKKNNDRHVLVW